MSFLHALTHPTENLLKQTYILKLYGSKCVTKCCFRIDKKETCSFTKIPSFHGLFLHFFCSCGATSQMLNKKLPPDSKYCFCSYLFLLFLVFFLLVKERRRATNTICQNLVF